MNDERICKGCDQPLDPRLDDGSTCSPCLADGRELDPGDPADAEKLTAAAREAEARREMFRGFGWTVTDA